MTQETKSHYVPLDRKSTLCPYCNRPRAGQMLRWVHSRCSDDDSADCYRTHGNPEDAQLPEPKP